MPRLSYPPGYIGVRSAFTALFPAAQTLRMPADSAADMASLSAWLNPPPPHELLVTRTLYPCCFKATIWLKQSVASESLPLPFASRNLQARILVCQLIPAIPVP